MNQSLPVISNIDLAGKNVIVRAGLEWESKNSPREIATRNIVEYLQVHGAKRIKIIGHKGNFVMQGIEIINDLRTDAREEADEMSLALELAEGFDIYVNESFETSHRKHCSIDALPRLMKQQGKLVCVGMRFEAEVEKLDQISQILDHKLLIIGGAKAGDKAKYADKLAGKFDDVLRGGLLPGVSLRPDGLDISDLAIDEYKARISLAKLIVVAGPLGKYEEVEKGTKEVFEAVTKSVAYKIAGGGDTEAAIDKFGLRDKFDWISVGGGAMLQYLADGTLPGIQSLIQ